MDQELDRREAIAYLRKQAGLLGEVAEVGRRFANPVTGLAKGWAEHSPISRISAGDPRTLGKLLKTQLAERRLAQGGGGLWQGAKDVTRRALGTGTHLSPGAAASPGLRGVAEGLSRHGWTGASRATKYLPVGDKGQMALFGPGMALANLRNDPRSDYGPAQGAAEALGLAGGSVLTAGTGVPGMAASLLAGAGAGRLGKILDDARRARMQAPA